ncbi:hypothetical protein KSS87_010826 [Heliosperma pusillum]|nr:hypothetical protein KSS87_010826 [Heliosperma pusillum]
MLVSRVRMESSWNLTTDTDEPVDCGTTWDLTEVEASFNAGNTHRQTEMLYVTTPTMAESDDERDEGEMKVGGIDGRGAAGYGDVQGVPRLRKKCDMQGIYGDDDSDFLPCYLNLLFACYY